MNRSLVVSAFGGLVLVMWLTTWSVVGSAEPSPGLLTGELWRMMSPDAKVAFVWGIGKGDVVRQIDAWYEAHPDQVKRPVVDALFQAVVLPTLKGRP
jgi:hypothetical protein